APRTRALEPPLTPAILEQADHKCLLPQTPPGKGREISGECSLIHADFALTTSDIDQASCPLPNTNEANRTASPFADDINRTPPLSSATYSAAKGTSGLFEQCMLMSN